MQIFFSYDKKQVIQALRLHFIGRNEVKLLMILVNVFAIFSAAMLYFQKVSPLAFLLTSFLWMGIMAAFWFILPNTVYKRTSTFKDSFQMNFDNWHISVENERGHTEWEWNEIFKFIESPYFFHLYFDSKSFFLVPKAAVETKGILSDLRRLIQQKVVKKV